MSAAMKSARLVPVTDESGPTPQLHLRAKALMEKLKRLDIPMDMSPSELKNVLGVDPVTWGRMQAGLDVRPTSFTKAETALASYVDEHELQDLLESEPSTVAAPEMIEYEIEGAFGFKTFRAKAPVADARELEESVIRILMRLQQADRSGE